MVESSIIPDKTLIEASADMVAIASVVGREHGSAESIEDGRTVTRCKVYRNLTCDEHQQTSSIGLKFLNSGSFSVPTVIWCDTLGKEMFRRGGNYGSGAGADQIVRDLSRALDRIPGERRSRAEYETHVQPLDEGERAFTERRWNDAIKMLTSAKNGPLPALTKAADEKLSEIRKIGERLLLEAQAYLEIPEVESARERLKLLSEQFIALECGRKAAELLKSLDEAQSKKR